MRRKSGILLPVTSLPSRYGIGDLGPEAFAFAEFIRDAGQAVWQVLPLTAIDGGCGNSPYSPTSAFAGNPLLISPDALASSGLLSREDLGEAPVFEAARVDYDRVRDFKDTLLRKAWTNFKRAGTRSEYERFFSDNRHWLEGYSFFAALKGCRDGQPWYEWPEDLKFRRHEALHRTWVEMGDEIEFHRFVQYLFASQMAELRSRLADLNIELVGDVPVYVTRDCADVWLHPHLFELDETLAPTSVAG
ncbi:MAG: 4-alpha-glucanotransferase, partial [Fretibacterium sp.]|nr:4-alpha-glucanotransferase [Fretibacterium sp.]